MFQILFSAYEDCLQFRIGTREDSVVVSESEFWCIVQASQEFQRVFTAECVVKGLVYYSGKQLVLQRHGKSIYLDPKFFAEVACAAVDLLLTACDTALLMTSLEDTGILFYDDTDLAVMMDPEDSICIRCSSIAQLLSQGKIIAFLEDSSELRKIVASGETDFFRDLVLSKEGRLFSGACYVCVIKCDGYDSVLLLTGNKMFYVKYPDLMLKYAKLSEFQKRLCKGDLLWTKQKS